MFYFQLSLHSEFNCIRNNLLPIARIRMSKYILATITKQKNDRRVHEVGDDILLVSGVDCRPGGPGVEQAEGVNSNLLKWMSCPV